MKIGILTFHYPHNYGAMLQAYALQNYLNSQGNQTVIIDYRIHMVEELYRALWKPYTYMNGFRKSIFHPFFRFVNTVRDLPYKIQSQKNFKLFLDNLETTELTYDINKININEFDCVVCGSDQIWDPKHTDGYKGCFWGKIENYKGKVISYAPSMGNFVPNETDKTVFREFFSYLNHISVRDVLTKEKCQSLCNKEIQVVLDPTFLMPAEFWIGLCDCDIKYHNYVLVYNLNNDLKIDEKARFLKEQFGYEILELKINDFHRKTPWKKVYSAGPRQFLGLIKNAEIVLTSSFHASVFSLLFHKEFYASNTTRIYDLLMMFNLSNRIVDMPINYLDHKINYENIDYMIDLYAKESKAFLRDNLV